MKTLDGAPPQPSTLEARPAVRRTDPVDQREGPPAWTAEGDLSCPTFTPDELPVVCPEDPAPPGVGRERGSRSPGVGDPVDFSPAGALSSVAALPAETGVSICAAATRGADDALAMAEHPDLAALRAREVP